MSTIAMSQQQNSAPNGTNPSQNTDPNQNPNPGNSIIENSLRSLLCKDPFPIAELDELVLKLQNGNAQERKIAQEILILFKKDENSWSKVDGIIENTQQQETKYFALQILEHTISTSWKILPREQCEAVKNFTIQIIIDLCTSIENMKQQKLYLSKLNLVLVKIIKQDWPLHWPGALGDIVGAAKQSEPLCQNNLEVLRLLTEEIFIFGENEMVQSKIKNLKGAMNEEFGKVFELCYYVLENSDNEELVSTCLKTLLKFISWIPGSAFFNTHLIEKLTTRLLPYQGFRNDTLACLTEIIEKSIHSKSDNFYHNDPAGANLQRPNVEEKTLQLYAKTFNVVNNFIPENCDLRSAYQDGADHDQTFIQNLAIFLSTFGKNCQKLVEEKQSYQAGEDGNNILQNFVSGLNFLVKISYIEDVEVFKICLDFWSDFSNRVYASLPMASQGGQAGWGNWGSEGYNGPYAQVLKDVRLMMICKMAKPEEVLVGTNEQGEVVRTKMQDTANLLLYNICRQTLVFLRFWGLKRIEGPQV